MKLTLKLDCNNDAFGPGSSRRDMRAAETVRILIELADRIARDPELGEGQLTDINGNHVGEWGFRAGRVLGLR